MRYAIMCYSLQAYTRGRIVNHATICRAQYTLRERTHHRIEIVLCVTLYRCGSRLCRKCKPCVGITWFTYRGNNVVPVICGLYGERGMRRMQEMQIRQGMAGIYDMRRGVCIFRMDMWVIRMGITHMALVCSACCMRVIRMGIAHIWRNMFPSVRIYE